MSPMKSVRNTPRPQALPKSTAHDVLHKRLMIRACKMLLLQSLKPEYKPHRFHFVCTFLEKIKMEITKADSTSLMNPHSEKVLERFIAHNVRLCSSENIHMSVTQERDSLILTVWCGFLNDAIISSFFFVKKFVNGND